MDTICSSHKSLYRDFLSTRPTRLGEPPPVSLLLWSRGGLVIAIDPSEVVASGHEQGWYRYLPVQGAYHPVRLRLKDVEAGHVAAADPGQGPLVTDQRGLCQVL